MKNRMLYCLSFLCIVTASCCGMDEKSLENPELGAEELKERIMSVDEYVKGLNFSTCKIGDDPLYSDEEIDQISSDLKKMKIIAFNKLVSRVRTRGKTKRGKPDDLSPDFVKAMRDINYTLQGINAHLARDVELANESSKKEKELKEYAYKIAFGGFGLAVLEFIVGGGWLASLCGEDS